MNHLDHYNTTVDAIGVPSKADAKLESANKENGPTRSWGQLPTLVSHLHPDVDDGLCQAGCRLNRLGRCLEVPLRGNQVHQFLSNIDV